MSWFSRAFSRQNDHARQLVADGALLLDVRTSAEYAGGHLEGAVNIPVQELGARVAEVGAKSRPVVVYCRSGGRSCSAAGLLTKAGYQVVDVGGMGAY
jgi:rhodanese-related sulfurtransferase